MLFIVCLQVARILGPRGLMPNPKVPSPSCLRLFYPVFIPRISPCSSRIILYRLRHLDYCYASDVPNCLAVGGLALIIDLICNSSGRHSH